MSMQSPRDGCGFLDAGRPGVLIVEDEFLIAINNAGVVDDVGCDVIGIAATAAEALAIAEQRGPELAVIDITLGDGIDGIELARRLIARHGLRVIFASAQHDGPTRERAEAVGPAGFLRKPFTDRALQDLVRRALSPDFLLGRLHREEAVVG
jgi:DNA-binding NarL/FixJ family response regulator